MARPLEEVVEAGWARALAPVAQRIADMGDFLRAEIAAGRKYLPAGANVLRAFTQPFDQGKRCHCARVVVLSGTMATPGKWSSASTRFSIAWKRLYGAKNRS